VFLQSCTVSLQALPGSSNETFRTSSDGTFHIGNIEGEEDIDMQEEEEVSVKTKKGIGSKEVECVDIKNEEAI